jgi:hypothetical protein
MSWLYSQALVAEYSEDTSLDGALCALWNGTPTQRPSWLPAKTTDACRLSRSGMTFKPLTAEHGEAVLMSFLAAFPDKTSAQPEREQVSTENEAACGRTWPESLAKLDPVSRSWKTRQCLLFEDSDESFEIWPRWGIMQGGECWELPTPALRTSESESGSWATPQASDCRKVISTFGSTLRNRKDIPILGTVEGWINPELSEWLMGWPIGQTDLKPLETDKFRQWRHSHGAF